MGAIAFLVVVSHLVSRSNSVIDARSIAVEVHLAMVEVNLIAVEVKSMTLEIQLTATDVDSVAE
jgi:hypothetical protein